MGGFDGISERFWRSLLSVVVAYAVAIQSLLIAVGAIVLYSNWRPTFDPWPILWTYWPLILIFIGAGKIWDSWQRRQNPDARAGGSSMGATIGTCAFVIVLVVLLWHGHRFNRWRGGTVYAMQHQSRSASSPPHVHS